ncbi:hypothetical protein KAH94_00390 [bacterium]|nr:hypothetical protein [bacterium]
MENNQVKRVNMLILLQSDLEAAVQFYQDFGFTKKFHLKDKWAEFDLNGISFGLCPISQEALSKNGVDSSTGFRTGIVLEVEELNKLCEDNADSMTFLSKPIEAAHGLMVSFKDPGGNIIDLYQPTPEKLKEFVEKNKDKDLSHEGGCCDHESCPK